MRTGIGMCDASPYWNRFVILVHTGIGVMLVRTGIDVCDASPLWNRCV